MRKLLYLTLLVLAANSFAQGEANMWYFGRNAALNFAGGTPTNVTGSLLDTHEGCSSFSDANGNLLFYIGAPSLNATNLTIWDKNNNPMPNGVGLQGDASSSQSALTVPKPGSTTEYFIFTIGAASSNNAGFFYYTLDMTLNGGLGDIVGNVTPLHQGLAGQWTEKVTAVKGSECNTFWVLSQVNNEFWAYKVTASGVDPTPVKSFVDNAASDVRGYLKVSPDGTKLVTAHYNFFNNSTNNSLLILYSFDNATGIVSNNGNVLINTATTSSDGSPYGVEFNINSDKLYASTYNGNSQQIFQFDLNAADIGSSKTQISNKPGRFRGALQLAPNGKIYAASPIDYNTGVSFLDVIDNPNEDATNVVYIQDAVNLGTGRTMQGLPPFISSIYAGIEISTNLGFGPVILNDITTNICNGINLDINPEPLTATGTISYNWYYNNSTTPFANVPNISFSNVTDAINGTYKLIVTFTDACGEVTTLEGEFTIEVFDQPTATQPPNMVQCDDDNNGTMPFMLTDQNALINTDAGMSITYYSTQAEADAGTTGALTSPFESGTKTIYARVENIANTPCYDTTSFNIEVYETAFPSTNVTLLADCDNTSVGTDADGFIVFNLHDRETEIANTQSLADFTLTYFTDANYTMQIPAADETAFTNTVAGGQTIYVRMTNNANSTCFTDTSFNIEVYPLPVLLTNTVTLIQCNDDLTLIEPFNLRLKEDEISANAATETFTYYETLADAEAGITSTQITNPTSYTNQIAGFDTVWARIQNADGCHRTAQINLDVNPSSAVMNGFATMQFFQCDDGADNRDGIATFNFSSVTSTIQSLFAPLAVDVLYYETEAQANQGLTTDQLDPTNYDNIVQDQLIWVQIVSDFGSDCLAKGQYVQLHVEALPTANAPTTLMKQCDDDNDGFFAFNTSTITSEILNGQSLADVNITYFNQNGTPISGVVNSSLPDPFLTNSQTINIVVTNNTTNDPDGACSDATTLTFIVDQLPINNVQPIPAICETDPDDGLLIATFDTSNLENSINAQAGMQITYLNSNGNPLQDADGTIITSPFPNSFTTQSQTITVVVTNPLNPTCPSEVSLDFIVNPRPIFDDLEDQIVCENILPHLITVTNPDANNYNYEWYNSVGTMIGNNQTLPITNTTDITVTGVDYSVTVTNPTTNCSRTKTVHLKKSSIATLLDTDIVTIEFNSPNNSITINTDNLGIGDYEFALEHNSDARPYQDEPVFTDLQGGVYTILINDKNDCGEISKIVFLLDYPKFLTPNNDGHNDVWQLIGLDSTSYTVSPIQIYDRFGKIVAIINPISGEGWDGFYNNKMLPSTDYWFLVTLTDTQGTSEIKKGHFSLIRR